MNETASPAAGEAVPIRSTSIAARINGADYTCEIPRSSLDLFERLHGSANALFSRIHAGHWTSDELRTTLLWSLNPPSPGTSAEAAFLAARIVGRDTVIDRAFLASGPARYQPLAAAVLAGALFGLTSAAPEFSDEEGDDVN